MGNITKYVCCRRSRSIGVFDGNIIAYLNNVGKEIMLAKGSVLIATAKWGSYLFIDWKIKKAIQYFSVQFCNRELLISV